MPSPVARVMQIFSNTKDTLKMDDTTRDQMNAQLDILFDQIEALEDNQRQIARGAVLLWQSAKVQESVGLGPMETRTIYHDAYDTLKDMGLNVSGMIKPYRGV